MNRKIDKKSREFIKINKERDKVEDVPLKPKFRHIYNDMPDIKGIPMSFHPLLMIGKKAVVVELMDYKFKIATLEEWEEREIRKSYSNVNMDTYRRIYKIDTLTHCVMEIEHGGNKLQFTKEDQIPLLRNMLLCMSPIIIDSLFFAYLTLLQKVEEEFNAKYKDIDQQILEQVDKAFSD